MDNLVLIRAARALHESFRRAVLREIRDEPPDRFRIFLETESSRAAIVVSLRPDRPWLGGPAARYEGPRRSSGPFAALAAKHLHGSVLESVEKLGPGRAVALRFAGGDGLVAELATHGANLILLDGRGIVLASARHPRSAAGRLAAGAAYEPPALPPGKFSPFGANAEAIDRFVADERTRTDDSLFDLLRRRLFGIGSEGALLVSLEAASRGASPGVVLAGRLAALERGELDPVVEAAGPRPLEDAERGRLDPRAFRLLPWDPGPPPAGKEHIRGADAAATAGLFHECLERSTAVRLRIDGLGAILRGEIQRTRGAEARTRDDRPGVGDPDRYRIWGESLLAGLSVARRVGDHAIVPDPYDAEGKELVVPCAPGMPLAVAAEGHFRKSRRARRGIEAAERRLLELGARRERLERIASIHEAAASYEDAERLSDAMRAEGIAVGFEPALRAERVAARSRKPRLEGVRLFRSGDGAEILVGRTGRDNDRLTFRLAGPDDFWLHAKGVPGAHVVVRNPGRVARPTPKTLEDAGALAAWFSDARDAGLVEVQWTRRKQVRRLRGAPPGTVTLKRFESLRVRPAVPPGSEEEGKH